MADTVKKNQVANTGKYSYKYVDIAQIHEYLQSIGASYYQYIDRLEGDDYIMTVKIIDGKESQPLRGAKVVDAKLNGVVNPAQEQGSALTYARRYSLLMAFGLATEDDDAQTFTRKNDPRSLERLDPHFLERLKNVPKLSLEDKIDKLKQSMTTTQWLQTMGKFGLPTTWTEEQVDRWLTQMEGKNAE